MAFQMNVAVWLAVNIQQCEGSSVTIDELHEMCKNLTPQTTKDVIAKMLIRLFNVEPSIAYKDGKKIILYKNLVVTTNTCNNPDEVVMPTYCRVMRQSLHRLQFECPVMYIVNGNQVKCIISFTDTNTILNIAEQSITLGFSLPINQQVIRSIISTVQTIRLCNGVPSNDKLPKTFKIERVSYLQNDSLVRDIGRSKSCKTILPLLGKTESCKTCSDSYNRSIRRSVNQDKTNTSTSNEISDICDGPPQKQPLTDVTSRDNVNKPLDRTIEQCERVDSQHDHFIDLTPESHTDMQSILKEIVKDGSAGQFQLLLESQLRNGKKTLDVHQRRWDPKVISICLGILLRSPQAYTTLQDSNLLILPSRRTLQYYKNVVKQKPGFNYDNLNWMKKQAESKNVSQFGFHGGLLIDEMTIQDDLVITKQGDRWNIVGMVDMGPTNNNIRVLTGGKKKVQMATQALQYVFHGFTGFRWPVVYFGSSTATAHELYTTFWECVDKLDEFGFTVDYVMLDGASTNRAFINMLIPTPRESKFIFPDVFFHKHSICAIQDVMHLLKKVRNNLESSNSDNRSKAGRFLVLNDIPILWDHWQECFNFNFQGGFSIHRKLTEEHIVLTPASKMRNHLAIQVLDKDMLFLMKSYQSTLQDPARLSASVSLLEKTAEITNIFCDHNRPISSLTDERLNTLEAVRDFFNSWESEIKASKSYIVKKNLMTAETRDDLNSSLTGFLSLCRIHVKGGNSINPGYLNSDLVENFFCQQRGIRNGLNTNPTLAQYGPSKTAIILGQHSISNKANSGTSTALYTAHKPCPLNPQRNKSEKRRGIRI